MLKQFNTDQEKKNEVIKKHIINLLLITILFFLAGCKKQDKYLQLEQPGRVEMTRQPAVAGAFYPADKTSLINKINSFLKKAEKTEEEGLRILIVPHAGYDYSGQTAAWGFKQLENSQYSKIILLGSSHQAYFSGAAVYNKGFWQTPLGKVEIDEDLTNTLINQSNLIKADLDSHNQEHSLEVELPFLQHLLKNFKIAPILIGQSNDQLLEDLSLAIADNFDDKTLLLISSDLSHYPDYETANRVDKETIEAILTGNVDNFSKKAKDNLDQPGVDTCACGDKAIKTAMLTANKLNITNIKLLNYTNSGNTGPDKSRVVGYAAIGFYSDEEIGNTENTELNTKQQHQLLQIARQTLENYLKDKKIPKVEVKDKALNQKLGAFVTLRKNGGLKGCIGQFEAAKPLYQIIQDKAIDAALRDPRFSPVKYEELEDIIIEVSVLSPRKKIDDWQKIELGKHGVVIKKGLRSGTYLPQVATETGWDLETFLSSLCSHKTGLANDCYKDKKTEIFIFTAQVFEEEEN